MPCSNEEELWENLEGRTMSRAAIDITRQLSFAELARHVLYAGNHCLASAEAENAEEVHVAEVIWTPCCKRCMPVRYTRVIRRLEILLSREE